MASSSENTLDDAFDDAFDQFFDQAFENFAITYGNQEEKKKKTNLYRTKPRRRQCTFME